MNLLVAGYNIYEYTVFLIIVCYLFSIVLVIDLERKLSWEAFVRAGLFMY